MLGGDFVLWIGCLLDFEILHSKVEADKHELVGAKFKELNYWRSPVYVTREKSFVFIERSSYDILR